MTNKTPAKKPPLKKKARRKAGARFGVPYVEERRRADGGTAYHYCPPSKDVKAGYIQRAALGTDLAAALAKARRYNAILRARRRGEECETRGVPQHGTLDWAVQRFREKRNRPTKRRKKPLSEKTQRDYDSYLDRTVEIQLKNGGGRLGDMPLKHLKPRHAERIYEIFGKADAEGHIHCHRAGLYAIQVCRRLWELVARRELELYNNPFKGLDVGGVEARETEWSYDEVADFAEAAEAESLLSQAAAGWLGYDLVQRETDLLRLTWGELYAGTKVQSKGGQRAYFMLSPELESVLEALKKQNGVELPRDNGKVILLYEATGEPYEERHFRKKVAAVRQAAGLSDELKFGDLRRSGATALTTAGATDSEARSVTGHATVSVFQKHYDREKAEKAAAAHDKRMAAREVLRAARAARKAATGTAAPDQDPAGVETEPATKPVLAQA